jgi:hypothetical protein
MSTIIKNIINEKVLKSLKQHFWSGSEFEPLLKLGSDERGEIGEQIVNDLVKDLTEFIVVWEGNKNTGRQDGSIWDILINGFRTEVKTAMRGSKNSTWQHEKIVEDMCWDKLIFVDIDYSGIWFTIQNYGQIPYGNNTHKVTGTKSTYHLGGWKFDLSTTKIKKLETMGYSLYYDIKNPNNHELITFFEKHFRNDSETIFD